jgi:hypothetical protein
MGAFINGLKNVGTTLGNYERAKMAQRGGLVGSLLARYLPGGNGSGGVPNGVPAVPPPSGPIPPDPPMAAPNVVDPLAQQPIDDQSAPSPNSYSADVLTPTPMARGGVATKPTLAVIAEKGPEIVAPVGRYKRRS